MVALVGAQAARRGRNRAGGKGSDVNGRTSQKVKREGRNERVGVGKLQNQRRREGSEERSDQARLFETDGGEGGVTVRGQKGRVRGAE